MNQSEDKEYQEYLKNKRDIEQYYEGLEIERVTQDLLDARDKRNALIENIREFNPEALFADGFEDSILGYDTKGRVIYSVNSILGTLVNRDGMDYEQAQEYFGFNIECAYIGEYTPIYMHDE